jgi:hypothetical protein
MSNLTVNKTYSDGSILFASDLDNMIDSHESFLNITKLDDANINNTSIIANESLQDSSITTAKIASLAITTAKLAVNNIQDVKINDLAITTAKLADGAVTTAKLADSSITNTDFNNASITKAKLVNVTYSAQAIGNVTVTSSVTTSTPIPGLNTTITGSGNPIEVMVIPHGADSIFQWAMDHDSEWDNGQHYFIIELLRDGSVISTQQIVHSLAISAFTSDYRTLQTLPSFGSYLDQPGAGTFTYSVNWRYNQAGAAFTINNYQIFCREV